MCDPVCHMFECHPICVTSDQQGGGQFVLGLISHMSVPRLLCILQSSPQPCHSGVVWDVA